MRYKLMPLPSEKWDLIALPNLSLQRVQDFYDQTKGAKYDWAGCLGIALPALHQNVKKWFCSEWCAAVLGLNQPAWFGETAFRQPEIAKTLSETQTR